MKKLLLFLALVPAFTAFASPLVLIVDSSTGSAAAQAIAKGLPDATVLEVTSGGDAAKRLESFFPNVIIVGSISGSPGQDEWKAMARVQNEKPSIPVIKISPLEPAKAEQHIREAGGKTPQGYLQAPFKDEDLVGLVEKLSENP